MRMMRITSLLLFCLTVVGCEGSGTLMPAPDAGALPVDMGGALPAQDGGQVPIPIDMGMMAGVCADPPHVNQEPSSGPRPDLGDVPPADELGAPVDVQASCTPPPLPNLDDIPDDPALDDGDVETVAIFEVDQHRLVSKFVIDRQAAEDGLKLWQELIMRIPANQLRDLVQFEISTDTDPVAYFNRTGRVTSQRNGLKLGFSTANFTRNQADVCAPLEPRRGTFDWSLVHEFGHLRGWLDGSWDRFLETFEDVRGPGDGYPEDGSPVLTGDFVTSYAERADGDEDHAESWTTFVMLDQLPPETPDEPLALKKVRWMNTQPGLVELRAALRITEPDGGNVRVEPAPRRQPTRQGGGSGTVDCDQREVEPFEVPSYLHGAWGGMLTSGVEVRFEFTADDMTEYHDGVVQWSMRCLLEQEGKVVRLETSDESGIFGINGDICPSNIPLDDSFAKDPDADLLYWTRLTRPGAPRIEDVVLQRLD